MRKLLSALAAVVLAASFALPLKAAPIFPPTPEQVQIGSVELIRHRSHHWRADRYWNHRYAYRSCGYYGRCYNRYPRYYGYRYPGYYGYRYPGYYGYRDYPGYYGYRDYYHRRPGVSLYFRF
ncbi:hypothetical protein FHX08_002252 [Rhizobium sp. BK529]|uniref:hypothetical protein n=1 Tax=Rhizobium sp. BK529 TaxID=2586983 RepID=UPI001046F1AA|nr:hypothetical protein [Rhizobium sp. BK529]TCS08208.1 hypothetical protein EV281_10166 [Rhizobium sp. BK418]